MKNADGQCVAGSTDGVTAAAEAAVADLPADFRAAADHQRQGRDGLPDRRRTPTSSPTWTRTDADKGKTSSAFTCWALTDGQATET